MQILHVFYFYTVLHILRMLILLRYHKFCYTYCNKFYTITQISNYYRFNIKALVLNEKHDSLLTLKTKVIFIYSYTTRLKHSIQKVLLKSFHKKMVGYTCRKYNINNI